MKPEPAPAGPRESRTRLRWGFLLLAATTVTYLGFAWDVSWHADVGPDTFFSPPHSLMYTGVTLAGLLSLYMGIRTTIAFRRGAPGVTEENTSTLLRWRAPLGFIVAGCGALAFLLSGLFDLWWHELYGFDVTEVSPPHFAIAFSALAQAIGTVYVFASEGTRGRHYQLTEHHSRWPAAEVGFAMALGVLMTFSSSWLTIGLIQWIRVGPLLGYPLMVAVLLPLFLVAGASFVRRPGAATAVAAVCTLLRVITWYGVPAAVSLQAGALDLPLRVHALAFSMTAFSIPPYLILTGVLIDVGLALVHRRHLPLKGAGWAKRVGLVSAATLLVNHLIDPRWLTLISAAGERLGPERSARYLEALSVTPWPTLVAVPAVAALAGWIGWQVGVQFRYTDR